VEEGRRVDGHETWAVVIGWGVARDFYVDGRVLVLLVLLNRKRLASPSFDASSTYLGTCQAASSCLDPHKIHLAYPSIAPHQWRLCSAAGSLMEPRNDRVGMWFGASAQSRCSIQPAWVLPMSGVALVQGRVTRPPAKYSSYITSGTPHSPAATDNREQTTDDRESRTLDRRWIHGLSPLACAVPCLGTYLGETERRHAVIVLSRASAKVRRRRV
jgi:hypothetical protein